MPYHFRDMARLSDSLRGVDKGSGAKKWAHLQLRDDLKQPPMASLLWPGWAVFGACAAAVACLQYRHGLRQPDSGSWHRQVLSMCIQIQQSLPPVPRSGQLRALHGERSPQYHPADRLTERPARSHSFSEPVAVFYGSPDQSIPAVQRFKVQWLKKPLDLEP